jgi:hypothetical protein
MNCKPEVWDGELWFCSTTVRLHHHESRTHEVGFFVLVEKFGSCPIPKEDIGVRSARRSAEQTEHGISFYR